MGEAGRARLPLVVCDWGLGGRWVAGEGGPGREWSLCGVDTSSLEQGVAGDGCDASSVRFSHRARAAAWVQNNSVNIY